MDVYKIALKLAINRLVDAISDKGCEGCPCEKYYFEDYKEYVCKINISFTRDIRTCKEMQKQEFYKIIVAEAEEIVKEIPLIEELIV